MIHRPGIRPIPDRVSQICHFGEWLQGRLGPDGPVALVTLVPDGIRLNALRLPSAGFGLASTPGAISTRLLRPFLRKLDIPCRGRFVLRPPFAPGLGTGISTASLIAAARLAGFRGEPSVLARACIAVEGASDPLMFARPDRLLWASRQGRILAHMPAVPRAHLVAGFWGPPLLTRATDQAYDDIADLVAGWGRERGVADCAALASESAARCLGRRGPADDPTPQLSRSLGALGWAMSHSGAARVLIFAPGTLPPHCIEAVREAGLRGVRLAATGGP
ncbi:MAG: propanediol utilization protein [Paracoccaceae bacterium]